MFFSQALSIAPEDPYVLHEMGVIAFLSRSDTDRSVQSQEKARSVKFWIYIEE